MTTGTDQPPHLLKESVHRAAAKRLRLEAMNRGNRNRQDIEGKAPRWRNEESALKGTSASPRGHSVSFQAGSFKGALKAGQPGAETRPRSR